MKTPWSQDKKPKYVRQELRSAGKLGARPQRNSGRVWSSLRDVTQKIPLIDRLLIDNKTTDAKSYRILDSDWRNFKRDANRTPPGCHPVLQIDLAEFHLYVVDEDLWSEVENALLSMSKMLDPSEPEGA